MTDIFTSLKTPVIFETEKITGTHSSEHDVFDRHRLLEGFDQYALGEIRIALIGAGGLGSEIGMALVRKGAGELNIYDDDLVEITNLTRQHFFKRDLYKPKSVCLAENLSQMATNKSLIRGIPLMIQEATDKNYCYKTDIAIVAVDNYEARFFCSNYYKTIPVIFTAVNSDADSGHVFVQTPGEACFGCLFGDQYGRPARKCTGSSIDINKIMGGIVSYAVDSFIMKRQRDWNFKRVYLHGPFKDISKIVPVDDNCSFCKRKNRKI
ncbi:MAG: ThiF family adenylyltransferase [Thermodesulfobacteriota bacterium]|nr:ThiF family adenylyltransferase [Thermodesulfobacteriota bacterium]